MAPTVRAEPNMRGCMSKTDTVASQTIFKLNCVICSTVGSACVDRLTILPRCERLSNYILCSILMREKKVSSKLSSA